MANEYNYAELLRDSSRMIAAVRASGTDIDERKIAELYGIYYNAFAGMLRDNSVMYMKKMDVDGYPKIVITLGDSQYSCRDAALRDILKGEYDKLTRTPYKDQSLSYVHPYTGKMTVYSDTGVSPEGLYGQQQSKKGSRSSTRDDERLIKAEQSKEIQMIAAKNKELTKLAKNFKYDPNYDHYYNDRLPGILKELDSHAWTTAARVACIAFSCAGIVMSLTLL